MVADNAALMLAENLTPPHPRDASWIKVSTGRRFYPFAPKLIDIRINDIAHSLAKLERFNGHLEDIDVLYAVGQHSCHVHDLVPNPRAKFWALMHDAAEAYIGDMCSPIKEWMPDFRAMEKRLQEAIIERFEIPFDNEIYDAVKQVDHWIGFQEGAQKLNNPEVHTWQAQITRPTSFKHDTFEFPVWTPRRTRDEFLGRFFDLTQRAA